jgi:hypothetical protein
MEHQPGSGLPNGLVWAIERMAVQSVPLVVIAGVHHVKSAHARRQLGGGSSQNKMIVVAHESERPQDASGLFQSIDKVVPELRKVLIITEKAEPSGAASKDMPVGRVAVESPHSICRHRAALHPRSGEMGDFLDRENERWNKKDGSFCSRSG